MGATPASQPIGDAVYQALFQLDGRACALLLKDLSKAGLQFRCAARGARAAGGGGRCGAALPLRLLPLPPRLPPLPPPLSPSASQPTADAPGPRPHPPTRPSPQGHRAV